MSFHWFDNPWPKQQQHINDKFYISLSLSNSLHPFIINFTQIPFNTLYQLRVAVPAEEAEKKRWGV
jgi:hypothetical protein